MSSVDKSRYNELHKAWMDGAWLTDGEIQVFARGICEHGNPGTLTDLIVTRYAKAPHEMKKELAKLFIEIMATCTRDQAHETFRAGCTIIKKRLVPKDESINLYISTFLMLERTNSGLLGRHLMDLWTLQYKLDQVPTRFDLYLMMVS